MPTFQSSWYTIFRQVLESLYYLSGVAVAILVALGLRQITITSEQLRLTKEIAEAGRRREAVKFAAAQCKYFADVVIPSFAQLEGQCNSLKTDVFDSSRWTKPFPLSLSEIEQPCVSFNLKEIEALWMRIGYNLAKCLNNFENFAIPFSAGVADDAVGFQEASAFFCYAVRKLVPGIWYIRHTQGARYPSALSLFCKWENQRQAEKIAPQIKLMQAIVDSVDKNKTELI